MPLSILLPLVVFGIAGIVLLIRLMRPTPPLIFTDEGHARAIWDHRNHDAPSTEIILNSAKTHALIETASGPGLLWSFGVDPVTRLLDHPFDLKDIKTGLRIVTHDFTAPNIDIPLPEATSRRRWTAILEGPL